MTAARFDHDRRRTADPTVTDRYDTPVDAEGIVRRLVDLDGSGGTSTVRTAPTTNTAKAVLSALSPAPAAGASLAETYRRWKQMNGTTDPVGTTLKAVEDIESSAMAKSRRSVIKSVRGGKSARKSLRKGFSRYQEYGGGRTFAEWARRLNG